MKGPDGVMRQAAEGGVELGDFRESGGGVKVGGVKEREAGGAGQSRGLGWGYEKNGLGV